MLQPHVEFCVTKFGCWNLDRARRFLQERFCRSILEFAVGDGRSDAGGRSETYAHHYQRDWAEAVDRRQDSTDLIEFGDWRLSAKIAFAPSRLGKRSTLSAWYNLGQSTKPPRGDHP